MNKNPYKTRRLALIFSGVMDTLLGAAILLVGFGFFPIDVADYGLPFWVVMLVGGVLFTTGVWMVIHNYSRLDE
ncbi:MAG TPA: hypothetical protein VIS72_03580 [Anaerolineales bacterium]